MENEHVAIFDLHCDLLSYMTAMPDADPLGSEIGCSLPALREGRVQLQTLAIYTATEEGSADEGFEQSVAFLELLDEHSEWVQHLDDAEDWQDVLESDRTTVIASIENASAFCEEEEDLDEGFERLEAIIENTGTVLYISLTHNDENRFGGGNDSDNVGLKDDGRTLLEYLDGRSIAVDLSHSSDALARDILKFIDEEDLDIPVLASHSNFRSVHDHVRNLPDDLVREIIARGGLIGMNFYREFLHETDPDMLLAHILHGFKHGGENTIAFGSDFFYSDSNEDEDDDPETDFFHAHRNSAQFPAIVNGLRGGLSDEQLHKLCYANIYNFLQRLWG